uniref:Uncharacterized protein n=1 Tax=Equus asinus TaxID=9793 RepID=A0A8C4LEE5_EQUAS
MLPLLHEQDKMAPEWSHPEVNNNNIRLSSEAILSPILFPSGCSFSQLQDGLPKGSRQCNSSSRILGFHGVLI